MAKYINAAALMDKMWQVCGEEDTEIEKGRVKWDSGLWLRYKVFEETISEIPAADVRENTHGEWIEDAQTWYETLNDKGFFVDQNTLYFTDYIGCPECLQKFSMIGNETDRFIFCPNCGADMRGEEHESTRRNDCIRLDF